MSMGYGVFLGTIFDTNPKVVLLICLGSNKLFLSSEF